MKRILFVFVLVTKLTLSQSTLFYDDFSTTSISSAWQTISGTWTQDEGELKGYWSQSAAQTDQGVIAVDTGLYDANKFFAKIRVKVRNGSQEGGERFVLRNSAGNQILIAFLIDWSKNLGEVYPHYRKNNSVYSIIADFDSLSCFNINIGEYNDFGIQKIGNLVSLYVNNNFIGSFTDTIFNGNTLLGLATYGYAYYEEFQIDASNELNSFRLTSEKYTETENIEQIVQNIYGNSASLADWNHIKTEYGNNLLEFYQKIGLEDESNAMVMLNGERFWPGSNRQYYIQRFDNGPYPGFLVHDQIGSLYLGSWYGLDMNLLSSIQDDNVPFRITAEKYTETENIEMIIHDIFGNLASLADWEQIKTDYGNNLSEFYQTIGLINEGAAMVSRNGERFWSETNRQYFLVRYDNGPEPSFLIHDQIGSLYLGSWYELNMNILVNTNRNVGMVAYYPFNGNADDESGNGNNGIINNAELTLDRFSSENKAFLFNGINSYIDCGNDSSINIFGDNSSITLSAWVLSNPSNNGRRDIISMGRDYTSNMGYHLELIDNSPRVIYRLSNGDNIELLCVTKITSNTWNYIVSTYNGETAKIFINGELDTVFNKIGQIGESLTNLIIGCHSPFPPTWYMFDGKIDNIMIYTRVLNDSEIRGFYYEGGWNPTEVTNHNDLIYDFSMSQNYPNPFNPTSTIDYSIPEPCMVKINVYNLLGEEVARLVNKELAGGNYQTKFDAHNLSSGIYFYTINADALNGKRSFRDESTLKS